MFRTWPDELPGQVEVYPIQLPGRESRLADPPFTRLQPLVWALAQAIQPYLDMPFVLFGHSLGALISFELARQLRQQHDKSPAHLFVSAYRAPQIPNPDPPIHQLPQAEFVKSLRHLKGTPEAVLQNAELMELFLPILRADFAVHETYVYTSDAPLDCPISAFGGLLDDKTDRHHLAAWHEQTCKAFQLRMFPGDHFFLHSVQKLLLRAVSQDVGQLLSRLSGG